MSHEEIHDADTDQLSELDTLRTQAGPDSSWCVSVFRKAADGLRYNYCRRLPLTGFDLDKLPETFGGGTYLLRVINDRGKMVKAITIAFDPALWPAEPKGPATAPAAVGVPVGSDLASLVARMDEERKDRQRFLETLLTAVLTNKTSGPSVAELVDAQVKLRELAGGDRHRTEDSTVIQALRLGMEAAGLRGSTEPGEEDSGLLGKVVDKVAIPLMEAIRNGQNRAPAGPAKPAAALTAGNPPLDPAPRAAVTAISPELEPFLFLRRYSPQLLGWAKSNFPAERVASVIYNLVSDDFFPVLESFLTKSAQERFSILVQLDPRLQPYQTYLDTVGDALKQEMEIDSEPGDPEAGGGTDTAATR